MTRIKDVAEAANVSITTVSNVINKKGNVSEDVYRRITQIMKDLDYHPNILARNLKSNKTRFIGVVLPDIHGLYGQMVDGIMTVLNDSSYHLIIKTTNDYPAKENAMIDDLIDLGVKGLLVVPSDNNINQRMLAGNKTPYVLMERYFEDIDCSYVRFDYEKAVFDLTGRLIADCGLDGDSDATIALVAGPAEYLSERDCVNGFIAACKKVHYDILRVPHHEERAFGDLISFLQNQQKKPVGFVVTDESVARCLREALKLYGLDSRISALSGENWYRFSNADGQSFSSLAATECGAEAAKLLLDWINSPAVFESVQHTISFVPVKQEKIYAAPIPDAEELRILLVSSPAADALKKMLPNFTKHYGVSVNIEECSYKELYNRLLHVKPSANNLIDAYMIDFPWINSVIEKNLLLGLDDLLLSDHDNFLDNFIPCVRKQFIEITNHIYTIPIMTGSQMLFYRKDLFNQAEVRRNFYLQNGIELRPPTSWSEFNLIARFFTQAYNPNSPVKYGTCILGEIPTGIIEEFLPRQWSYNGRFVSREGELSINSTQNSKALDNLCEAYRYSVPESINYMEDEQIRDFIQGDVALISTFNSHILSMYNKEFAHFLPNMGFCSLPGRRSMLGGWVFGISKRSHAPELTYRFIKWACSDGIAIHNTLLGGLVPKNIVNSSAKLHKAYPWLGNIASMMEAGQKREVIKDRQGRIISQNKFEDELAQVLLQALSGKISSSEALKQLNKKMVLITNV